MKTHACVDLVGLWDYVEDRASWGQQVLIAYFLGFTQQRGFCQMPRTFLECSRPKLVTPVGSSNHANQNVIWKPLECCAPAARRTMRICNMLVWCSNKSKCQLIRVPLKQLVSAGRMKKRTGCVVDVLVRLILHADVWTGVSVWFNPKQSCWMGNLTLLFLPNDLLISPLFSLTCVSELWENLEAWNHFISH